MTTEAITQTLCARDQLRAAVDAVKAAKDAVQAAEVVTRRAAEDLNAAINTLQAFGNLDDQFSKVRIEALKNGRFTGYPAELREKRLERLAAQEEAQHCRRAHEVLSAELDNLRDEVAFAERRLDEAAAAVFTEQVGNVVALLNEANRQCEYLQRVLEGALLPFGVPGHWERLMPNQRTNIMADSIRGVGFPAGTLAEWRMLDAAASNAVHQARTRNGEVNAEARAYWQDFAGALKSNPNAEPGPLPDRDSLASI